MAPTASLHILSIINYRCRCHNQITIVLNRFKSNVILLLRKELCSLKIESCDMENQKLKTDKAKALVSEEEGNKKQSLVAIYIWAISRWGNG